MGDLLGEIIDSTRLRGRVFCQSTARAPWGLQFDAAAHAMFHLVTAGSALAFVGNKQHVLVQGDLLLLPRGAAHALGDKPSSPRIDLAAWLATRTRDAPLARLGGLHGAEVRVLCGVYELDGLGAEHPVLRLLPPLLHLAAAQIRAQPELSETLTVLLREHERASAGSSVVVSRLLDVLFVQLVRAWATAQPPGSAGWVGALHDPMLARALGAVHADLGRAWTVDTLARAAGTSRATLARRFVAEVGEAPLAYVTRARMQAAAAQLRLSDDGLAAIAARVGYASEFAFNRSFRRALGKPPGAYRRQLRAASRESAPRGDAAARGTSRRRSPLSSR